ncbi:helix-turn-helix domain-containing protein [Shewanella dokdonensis]|uniref:helix-turn-helix domain-containing protein n=1 Tax=Shewanella dokdonensis TaxID=712036 RepID=UPI00200CC1D6|nr:helix-turn-helix transcriptional regulator [Shewanella dokdonensis]MCL1075935.1 helix-turn-helix domain-containing protein [Shewanella dokdonensis]
MENDQMINSEVVKNLRKNAGWSQEQLAQAAGISLRTIQRVETAGKSSRETKLCLAATFNVDLADLEVKPHVINTTRRSNWVAATLFLLTATVSCIGLYNDVSNPLFFIANLTAISTFIYSVFSWYFASAPTLRADMRTTVNAGFIYLAIFAFFSLLGNLGTAVLMPMLLSLALFCSVFFVINRLVVGKTPDSSPNRGR